MTKSIFIRFRRTQLCSLMAALLALAAGCESGGLHGIKTRGIYTTPLTWDFGPEAIFREPNTILIQKNHFGTNEIPVAVIQGYEGFQMRFELVDLNDGKVLESKDAFEPQWSFLFERLTIQKSGNYEVRLLFGRKLFDAYRFSVEREQFTKNGKPDNDAIIARLSPLIAQDSKNPQLYMVRAAAYQGKGELSSAIADCDKAIQFDPHTARPFLLRAALFYDVSNWDGAFSDFNKYISSRPKDPSGFYIRASTSERRGNFAKASEDYQQALRIYPKGSRGTNTLIADRINLQPEVPGFVWAFHVTAYDQVCNSLAWLLATCPEAKLRDGKKSVELATQVCESNDWKSGMFIDTLAAAYAETGDFDSAIKFENKALQLAASSSKESEGDQHRLSLYEQHQPYREAAAGHERQFAN